MALPLPLLLSDMVNAGTDSLVGKIHTSLPAKVVAYDSATQTAHVQPMVKRCLIQAAGTKVYESLPVLPHVPVVFPRAGGWVITVPLQEGDFVWLNFSESALAEFLATGQESEPWDTRRHHLSGAVAIPGCYPDTDPLASADDSARQAGMVLGQDGGKAQIRMAPGEIKIGADASDYVALSTKVLTELQKIQAWAGAHTHMYIPGALPPVPSAAAVPVLASPLPVAAAMVKAK